MPDLIDAKSDGLIIAAGDSISLNSTLEGRADVTIDGTVRMWGLNTILFQKESVALSLPEDYEDEKYKWNGDSYLEA